MSCLVYGDKELGRWKVWCKGSSIEVVGLSKNELGLVKRAENQLESSEPWDKSLVGKEFEKKIFNKLKKHMSRKNWENFKDATFWLEGNKLIFDIGN